MLKIKQHIAIKTRKILLFLPAMLIGLVLAGCIEESYSIEEKAPEYVLRLNILAQGTALQTKSGGHALENGTEAESYIDVNDLCIVIYRSDGTYLTTVSDPVNTTPMEINGKKYYFIEKSYSASEYKALGLDENETVNILVLANWDSYQKPNPNQSNYPSEEAFKLTNVNTDGQNGQDSDNKAITNLWKNDAELVFITQTANGKSWFPSATEGSYIPMFGYKTGLRFNPRSNTGSYEITEIPMLRALAKIEVIDNTEEGVSIESATLKGYNTQGRIIPDITVNTSWYVDGTQITSPTIPAGMTTIGNGDLQLVALTNSDNKNVWTAYIPEMVLGTESTESAFESRPYIEIKGKTSSNNEYTYQLHFGDYSNVKLNEKPDISNRANWANILRNHIYSFQINSLNVYTDIRLTVNPWELAGEELWWYEEIPDYINPISWSQYNGDVDEESPAVTLNLSSSSNQILVGNFTLSQPKGAKWHAYLMTIGDAIPIAIEFCNRDGSHFEDDNEKRHISGDIGYEEETKCTLYIRATDPQALQYASHFKLIIMIENLGNWMEVKAVPTDGNGNNLCQHDNWEIIRPSNRLEI